MLKFQLRLRKYQLANLTFNTWVWVRIVCMSVFLHSAFSFVLLFVFFFQRID